MPEALAVRYMKVGTSRVFRSDAGTLSTFGLVWTPAAAVPDTSRQNKSNLAARFGNDFYSIVSYGEIRKFDTGAGTGGPWTNVPALAWPASADASYFTGLWVARGPADLPRIFFVIRGADASNPFQAVYLDPGGSWTFGAQSIPPSSFLAGMAGGQYTLFENKFFMNDGRLIAIYDVAGDSWTFQALGANSTLHEGTAFCQAEGRLFMARTAAGLTSTYVNLYEWNGTTFALLIDGSASTPSTLPITDARGASAHPNTDGDWLAMHYDHSAQRLILHSYPDDDSPAEAGWRVHSIDPSGGAGSVTDVTSTVIGGAAAAISALAWPSGPSISPSFDVHWHVEVDNLTDPSNQVTYVYLLTADGSWAKYKWNGTGSAVTQISAAFSNRGLALSQFQTGGAEYSYPGGTPEDPVTHVEEYGARTAIAGGARVFFRAYSFAQSGTFVAEDIDVELRFSPGQAGSPQAPFSQGTLAAVGLSSGAGSTPTLNANAAEGCTADGTSIYFYDWLAVTSDGLVSGDRHQSMPRIV